MPTVPKTLLSKLSDIRHAIWRIKDDLEDIRVRLNTFAAGASFIGLADTAGVLVFPNAGGIIDINSLTPALLSTAGVSVIDLSIDPDGVLQLGYLGLGAASSVIAGVRLEIQDAVNDPAILIRGLNNTLRDPQIQFATDIPNTVKCVMGVDATDDSFHIEMGVAGITGTNEFNMSTAGIQMEHISFGATVPQSFYRIRVSDTAIDTADSVAVMAAIQWKTAGATDAGDELYGVWIYNSYTQNGGVLGNTAGYYNYYDIINNSTIGANGSNRYAYGIYSDVRHLTGTIWGQGGGILNSYIHTLTTNGNNYCQYNYTYNAGTITGDYFGIFVSMGNYATVNGTEYLLYLDELTALDYCIYQDGTSLNRFGGAVFIEADNTAFACGGGRDAEIYYNNTNLVIDPDVVGSGIVLIGATGDDYLQASRIGVNVTPDNSGYVYISDVAMNTTLDEAGVWVELVKTAGASTHNDHYYGGYFSMQYNQNGGEIGFIYGLRFECRVDDGNVGRPGVSTYHAYGIQGRLDLNGGRVTGNGVSIRANIDQEAASVVDGDGIGLQLDCDWDGTVTGSTYMIYMDEKSNIDYGIYQNGSADNRFGGDVLIDADNTYLYLGGGQDFGLHYTGAIAYIETDLIAASDLYIDCGTNKTLELQETVWDDYITPLGPNNWRGVTNNPVLTKLFDDGSGSQGVYAYIFTNNDEALITIQMPHRWKEGTTIYPHIHFMCTSDVNPSDNFGIEFEYIWADIDEDFPANSTLETNDIATGVNTDNMHQLADITAAGISGVGHTISSVLLCRIKRVAASSDDYADGVAILDVDVHYEVNTMGSRQMSVK